MTDPYISTVQQFGFIVDFSLLPIFPLDSTTSVIKREKTQLET